MKTNKFFRSIAFTIILVCVGTAVSAQVTQKIGGNPFYMEPSAVLELESTTKGFLLPRMLKSEMNAIASPPAGMMVYCTDCGGGIGQLRVRYGSTTAGSWGIPSINLSGDVHASVDPTTGSNGTVIQSNVVSYAKMQTVTANTILGNGTNATGNVQEIASTGTGNVVRATSPILTSPTITGTGAIAGTFTGDITGDVTGNVTGSSGSTTGNAATATALATARTIGGVSFNGTANINLPGVNEVGNQNTSGNAATATKIASITNTNIVQLTETQTLTNKTLTSPTLVTPTLGVASATQITSMLGFRVAGSFAGSLAGSQGLYILWDSMAEETSFINVKGSGAGGFSFFNEDADSAGSGITPTPIVQITPVGEIKAGDVTYTNTTGTNGQVLTSNGAGETSWTTISVAQPTYVLGSFAPELGGIVIQLSPNGKHGLVVAHQDQSTADTWHYANNSLSDPNNHEINGKEFSDWRLPTLREGLLIIDKLNANQISGSFWTSTGSNTNGNDAWYINCTNSTPQVGDKVTTKRVRAVRAF